MRLSLKSMAAIMSLNPCHIFMKFKSRTPPGLPFRLLARRVFLTCKGARCGILDLVFYPWAGAQDTHRRQDFQHLLPCPSQFLKGLRFMFSNGCLGWQRGQLALWQMARPHRVRPRGSAERRIPRGKWRRTQSLCSHHPAL